ncbi:hypothetical protein Dsin_030183 [Dipteronia sinensis]|uniref:HhH-GPD domain-containing protein n=1 Tax=Dipteronia sinensis TaxID=43782 RepID=A0AAE0DR11_9ROSI|nr:hypothetical protein Dsin_030183 [Dipteronia sinensis]
MAIEDECLLKLLLPNSSWKLEKAVCSHGLFMMSPNHWDPLSRSFWRPLHLSLDDNGHAPPPSVMVRIFHPQETPNPLHVKVYNTGSVSLSSKEQDTLLGQWELQHCSSSISVAEKIETENFIPNTPVGKESKRKVKRSKVGTNLTSKIARIEVGLEEDLKLDCVGGTKEHVNLSSFQNNIEDDLHTLNALSIARSCLASEGREPYACDSSIGNFPSPRELANLDENFLGKALCSSLQGRIQFNQLEEVCNEANFISYDKLAEQLSKIDGFGPFTCANVLVCMGFYHVIPSDSETIRHLQQVHVRQSTFKTVQVDVEAVYRKYAPYQFLAYWSELWHFYEQRFGKLSEMPYSNYILITASNMGIKRSCKVNSKKC